MQPPDEEMLWARHCDRWDKSHKFAAWYDECKLTSVRFNPATSECGLYRWNSSYGRWFLSKEIEVNVFDPVTVSMVARKELTHDPETKSI